MKNKPLISFILPNYNNQHVLNLFFEKFLLNNTYDNYEFIVVDDGSEDDGLKLLYKWQKSGLIQNMKIFAEPHKGIINALNKALFAAKGDFIIRCDGDATIETKGFVEKFLDFYNIAPDKIGVITSKVISDTNWLHAIGRSIISENGLLDRGKKPNEKIGERTWDYLTSPVDNIDEIIDQPAECDMALGVLTFSDRETAIKIRGFDKNYPLWIEDDDFYLSYRLHGKKCFYLPAIEVCHRFSLRGDRNPDAWKKKSKIYSFLYSKVIKGSRIYFKFMNLPILKIKEKKEKRKYYLFGILIYKKKYLGWRPSILKHDYNYWKQKWGFDILNPSIEDIKAKYKGTEILWNYDKNLKEEGKKIISKYNEISLKKSNLPASKTLILIGEGCWFIDSFKYFKNKNYNIKVIATDKILWTCNLKTLSSLGATIIQYQDSPSFLQNLNMDKNTIILGGGNYGGDVASLKSENLYDKGQLELDILYKISQYNHLHNCGAKVIRYFNGDTGFGNEKLSKEFNEKIKYVDTLMFDNDLLKDFVCKNIPNAKKKKHLLGWIETPLQDYVYHNSYKKYSKKFISIGRIISSVPLGEKVTKKTLFYPYRILNGIHGKINNFVHKNYYARKYFYSLAGNDDIVNTLIDRKDFFQKHKDICFGLSHFYDIFQGSISKFYNKRDFLFTIEGQKYKAKNATKEFYYAFVNNPSKDIGYLMNGIIPLISHTEHNVYKEMVNKKMAILIKKPEDILEVLKMSNEEIQEYRNNIYKNRDLFTFDHVGDMIIKELEN